MRQHADLAGRKAGGQPGKLLRDPAIWFPVNAAIDGLDPWSPDPRDMMKYLVYQRRSLVEALRTQALMAAYINPEQAVDLAKQYIEVMIPTDPASLKAMEEARAQEMAEIAKMDPIPMSSARIGEPAGGRRPPEGSFGWSPAAGSFSR